MTQKAIVLTFALVMFVGLIGAPNWVAAQSPLDGAWDLQEGEGNFDRGVVVFHGQRYSLMLGSSERSSVAGGGQQAASADELRAAWAPFVANAGTFELTGGDTLTLRPSIAKNVVVGSGRFLEFRCALEDDGNTLVLTPIRNQNGAMEDGTTRRYRRADCCAR